MKLAGQIVDILNKRIFPGEISVTGSRIDTITELVSAPDRFIMPGFIDSHIHIESSMLVPSEFARMAVVHGTVATVSDPHEIANVLGVSGVHFMIDNGKKVPFKFHFGAPSCVPATIFETAGAEIDSDAIRQLMNSPDIYYLAEMMNYPGVLLDDAEVLKKIACAKDSGKPVDGHAPGLRGTDIEKYIAAGISTDHECFTHDEAQEKLSRGMKILIREGSAAKNFDALIRLLDDNHEMMMFCSDDKHPDDLVAGHINELCARAVALGIDIFKILQAACINPVLHYNMDVGTLKAGDSADFIIVENLETFKIKATYINGNLVAENGVSLIKPVEFDKPNNFNIGFKAPNDFRISSTGGRIRVIEALEGQLVTNEMHANGLVADGLLMPDIANDLLKISVVNRYSNSAPAVAFIKNFGLKKGAIASSVAHDSHNIIVVGTSDEEICSAVNLIIENRGGVCAVEAALKKILPLPVAGIISGFDGTETARIYQEVDAMAKFLGSGLQAPFMTLSFMALLVIPDLKLSDQGLFSGKSFGFTELEVT